MAAPARANNNSFLQQERANLTSYMINTTTNCQKFVTVNDVQKMNSYSKFGANSSKENFQNTLSKWE